MNHRLISFPLFFLLTCFISLDSKGEDSTPFGVSKPQRDRHVQARFLSERTHVEPGDSWWIALELKHDPKWHTYWLNGGDAGVPTSIDWQLPDGITAGPIQWEVPQIVKMFQLDVYGYEGTSLLLTQLKCHPDVQLPTDFELKAKVNWMMCAHTCLPGKGVNLSIKLHASSDDTEDVLSKWAPRIRQSVKHLPVSAPKDMFHSRYDSTKQVFHLNWKEFPRQDEVLEVYYFDTTEQITSNQAQHLAQVEEGWQLTLPRASYAPETIDRLKGVLRWKHAGAGESYQWLAINIPIQLDK